MFETKQNELNTRVCIIYPGTDINSPVLSQTSQFFDQKYFTLLDNVQISKPLMIWGVFYILKKSALTARRGMCSTLTYHSNFNLPTTSLNHPKFPPKIPKNHSRTTSTHLRKVLYFQQLSAPHKIPNPIESPKNPTPKSQNPK